MGFSNFPLKLPIPLAGPEEGSSLPGQFKAWTFAILPHRLTLSLDLNEKLQGNRIWRQTLLGFIAIRFHYCWFFPPSSLYRSVRSILFFLKGEKTKEDLNEFLKNVANGRAIQIVKQKKIQVAEINAINTYVLIMFHPRECISIPLFFRLTIFLHEELRHDL